MRVRYRQPESENYVELSILNTLYLRSQLWVKYKWGSIALGGDADVEAFVPGCRSFKRKGPFPFLDALHLSGPFTTLLTAGSLPFFFIFLYVPSCAIFHLSTAAGATSQDAHPGSKGEVLRAICKMQKDSSMSCIELWNMHMW